MRKKRKHQLRTAWEESPYALADGHALSVVLKTVGINPDGFSYRNPHRDLRIFLRWILTGDTLEEMGRSENLAPVTCRKIAFKVFERLKHPKRLRLLAETARIPFNSQEEFRKRLPAYARIYLR